MAEASSLSASILTFTAIAAKLSTDAAILYRSYRSTKDTPVDVQRVATQLKDLEFILAQINHTRSASPGCVGDPITGSYWASKEAKLRSDFTEFEQFTTQLTANIGKSKSRTKWVASHEGRAKEFLGLLAEDIEVLRTLLGIMES